MLLTQYAYLWRLIIGIISSTLLFIIVILVNKEELFCPPPAFVKQSTQDYLVKPQHRLAKHICTTRPAVLQRPDETIFNQVSKSKHFRIHYAYQPLHRPVSATATRFEVAQWLEKLAIYLEEAYQLLVVERGFKAPPTDGTKGGGQDLYDVYVQQLEGTAMGITRADSATSRTQSEAITYLLISNRIAAKTIGTINELKATAIHEFFHMIQNGYYGSRLAALPNNRIKTAKSVSLREGTAVWAETLCSNKTNKQAAENTRYYDYLTLEPNIFSHPYQALLSGTETELPFYAYSSVFFWKYLSEQYGEDIIRKIWEANTRQPTHQTTLQTEWEILDQLLIQEGGIEKVLQNFWIAATLLRPNVPYASYQQKYPQWTFREGKAYLQHLQHKAAVPILKHQHKYRSYWHRTLNQEGYFWELDALGGAAFYQLPFTPKSTYQLTISPPIGVHRLQATDLMAVVVQENRADHTIRIVQPHVNQAKQKIVFPKQQASSQQHLVIYRLTDAQLAQRMGTASLNYRLEWQ